MVDLEITFKGRDAESCLGAANHMIKYEEDLIESFKLAKIGMDNETLKNSCVEQDIYYHEGRLNDYKQMLEVIQDAMMKQDPDRCWNLNKDK